MLPSVTRRSGGQGAVNAAGSGGGTGASRAGSVDSVEQAGSEAKSRIGKTRFTGHLLNEAGLEGRVALGKGGALARIIGIERGDAVGQAHFGAAQVRTHGTEQGSVARIALGHGAAITAMVDPPERADERQQGQARRDQPQQPARH